MSGPQSFGGGSSKQEFKLSGALGTPIKQGGETASNIQTFFDPLSNLGRIKDKIDKNSGINDLIALQAQFDLETQSLLAQRDSILNSINSADLEASRAVRTARINEARTTGRASTILSR